MRTPFLIVASLFIVATTASAVEVSLGPTLAAKGTVNTVAPGTGLKTGFAFNSMPDIGLTTRMMFARDMSLGLALDVELTGYGYLTRPENEDLATDANTIIARHSYLTIAPSFYLGGLMLGVGIALPTGQTGESIDGSLPYTPDGTQASPVLEARIGAMVPLMRSKSGDLNLTIRGSYMLGGHYTADVRPYFVPMTPTSNPQSAGLSLGFTYLFHVVN